MILFKRLIKPFKTETELNATYAIVFGSSTWAEIYEIENDVCKSGKFDVYTFSDGIRHFGKDNYATQPGILVGVYADINAIKRDKNSILNYMKKIGCNEIPINSFLHSVNTYK